MFFLSTSNGMTPLPPNPARHPLSHAIGRKLLRPSDDPLGVVPTDTDEAVRLRRDTATIKTKQPISDIYSTIASAICARSVCRITTTDPVIAREYTRNAA